MEHLEIKDVLGVIMEEKEKYVVKKISKDCLFPETLCELKDTKSKFFVVLESKDDAVKIADLLNKQDKYIKELKNSEDNFCECVSRLQKEIQQLNEELDKYKETVQELQETSSKMFDKLLENHLCKFQENPYNEENQEFKNDIKLLISVGKQIKDFKNSQNQVAVDALNNVRNTLRFHTYNIRDDRFDYTRTMCLWTDINEIIDKQIENLKGD